MFIVLVLVVQVSLLERDSVLLGVVLHLVSPLDGQHVDDLERVEAGPLEDEALVLLVDHASQFDVLVAVVDRLAVALVQTCTRKRGQLVQLI